MSDKITCRDCKFWEQHAVKPEPRGVCHRYPPTVVYAPKWESFPSGAPFTHAFYWCGEAVAR